MSFHNHDPEDPQGFLKQRHNRFYRERQSNNDMSSLSGNSEPPEQIYISDDDKALLKRVLECLEELYHNFDEEDNHKPLFTKESECYKVMKEVECRIRAASDSRDE